ncbi:MAG: RluA family pseudouridine synthase [Clostridiales bacterium]|jgi:23S rRNA pseudouridine955/2504/2580 synthase|nr:RluA family pseudouridine synthase [Clostridiales bacterium]
MRAVIITPADSGRRFDKYLARYMNTAPKSLIYKLLRKKRVKLNGCRAEGGEILREGDVVSFYLAEETMSCCMRARALPKSAGDIDVIYEDEWILLINKPVGLLTHGDGTTRDTLTDRALYYLHAKKVFDASSASTFTPAVCNRLDRNTSGLVVCGKTLAAVQALNRMFAEGKARKDYLAAVTGIVRKGALLRGFWEKDGTANQAAVRREGAGKEIFTEYAPIGYGEGCSLLRIRLHTGRSHQIRAHMQSIGHAVLGDPKYGDLARNAWLFEKYAIPSQLLHAERIFFMEPGGVLGRYYRRAWAALLPDPFQTFVNTEIHT